MPKTKKSLLPRNLNTYDVFIEDRTPTSDYFAVSNLPSMFTGGRNSFLVNGSSFLEDGSEVRIEILDARGNPVFFYPVSNYTESAGTLISVEIYDTTATGIGTIIIMGKAKIKTDGTEIPEVWRNKFNVRWVRNILMDGYVPNTSPIRFLNQPQVEVEERIIRRAITASYQEYNDVFTASLSPQLRDGRLSGYMIYAETPSSFSSVHTYGVLTGSFVANNVTASVSLPVSSILNSRTAFSDEAFLQLGERRVSSVLLRSGSYRTLIDSVSTPVSSSVKMRYSVLNSPTRTTPTSYAYIRIADINTVSGEINKIRVYVKPASSFVNYKLAGDVKLSPSELLYASTVAGDYPIGSFITSSTALQYWYAGPLVPNTGLDSAVYPISGSAIYKTPPTGTSIQLRVTNDVLLSALSANIPVVNGRLSGSVSQSGYFIGTRSPITLFPNTEYTLSFDAYYLNRSGSVVLTGKDPKLDIYILGQTRTADPLGTKLDTIIPNGPTQWFQRRQINFTISSGLKDSSFIRFVVHNGLWYFSNISLQPANSPLFSPDEASIVIPNTDYTNDILQYKIEFFDINNNSTEVSAIATPTFFTGSATDYGTLP